MKKKNGKKLKVPESLKKWLRVHVQGLRKEMFLHEWTINLCYCSSRDKKDKEFKERGQTIASMTVDTRYLIATLHIHEPFGEWWAEKDRPWWRMFDALTHEMCHILTEPLWEIAHKHTPQAKQDWLKDVWERQTQRIATIIHQRIDQSKYNHVPRT